VYTGYQTVDGGEDTDYMWKLNDKKGNPEFPVEVRVDGKYLGNYLRFVNHHDDLLNTIALKVAHKNRWWMVFSR
jgi:hypothetical protein